MAPAVAAPPSLIRARRLLGAAFVLLLATVTLGLSWDRSWHATHAFDSFYSPPHIFIYSLSILTVGLVSGITITPGLRRWFGSGFRVPAVPFAVPGPLAIACVGLAMLALAAALDDVWHSNFGLDETGWSTPHAMLGWGWLITFLGFVACRLALRAYWPLRWFVAVLIGLLAIGFSATPFLGPLNRNHLPEQVQAIGSIPVLAAQTAAQHKFRIEVDWNLSRTNPVLLPLGALWAGAALGLLRAVDRRARVFLATLTLWTLLTALGGLGASRRLDQFLHLQLATAPAAWLPLPLLPAGMVLGGLIALRVPEQWAWSVAGVAFGLCVLLVWGARPPQIALALLAAPATVLGSSIGQRAYRVLEDPSRAGVKMLALAGVGVPFLFGLVDLYLRHTTP
ncbi:MAG TPA: hypothetical protein VEQ11_16090 [Chloroflexota bacterium]|nr:hypothetical protein [Chloroflexota bacterium]